MKDKKKYTTSFSSTIDNQNNITVGPTGPVLMLDVHLVDMLAHSRERIPERVVHAKSAGAFG